MSAQVAFPDFSARRRREGRQRFVCVLRGADNVGPTWVHVAGDLDAAGAPRLAQALALTDRSPHMVILDLRQLSSLDRTGVGVIVDASRRAHRAQHPLVVIRGSSQVDNMLTLSGAAKLLHIVDFDSAETRERLFSLYAGPDGAA